MRILLLLPFLMLGACATRDGGPVWPYPEPPEGGGSYPSPPRETGAYPPPERERGEPAPAATAQSTNPTIQALVDQAERERAAGDLEAAAATLERALRIDGADPLPWLRLAQLRFEQGNLIQSENLARRSLSYAGEGPVVRDAWLLIADIKRLQGDEAAADTARRRAAGGV